MNAHCVFSITKTGDIDLPKGQDLDDLVKNIINYTNKKGKTIVVSSFDMDSTQNTNDVSIEKSNDSFPFDYWVFYQENFLGYKNRYLVYNDKTKDKYEFGFKNDDTYLIAIYLNPSIVIDYLNETLCELRQKLVEVLPLLRKEELKCKEEKKKKEKDEQKQSEENGQEQSGNIHPNKKKTEYEKTDDIIIVDTIELVLRKGLYRQYWKLFDCLKKLKKDYPKWYEEQSKPHTNLNILQNYINYLANTHVVLTEFEKTMVLNAVILCITKDFHYNLSFAFSNDIKMNDFDRNKFRNKLIELSKGMKSLYNVIEVSTLFDDGLKEKIDEWFISIKKSFAKDFDGKDRSSLLNGRLKNGSLARLYCNISIRFEQEEDAKSFNDFLTFSKAKEENYPETAILKDELYLITYFITSNSRKIRYFNQDVSVCHSSLIFVSLASYAYRKFAIDLYKFNQKQYNMQRRVKEIHSIARRYSYLEIVFSKDNMYYQRQKQIYYYICEYNDFDKERNEIRINTENLWHEANMSYSFTIGLMQVFLAIYSLFVGIYGCTVFYTDNTTNGVVITWKIIGFFILIAIAIIVSIFLGMKVVSIQKNKENK